ncbi:hypothetical protein, partial [Mesorhizobium sp. M4A.F.Ca.ET.090.04.2.1]
MQGTGPAGGRPLDISGTRPRRVSKIVAAKRNSAVGHPAACRLLSRVWRRLGTAIDGKNGDVLFANNLAMVAGLS